MNGPTRSERIFEEVTAFIKTTDANLLILNLYGSEIRKLEKYFQSDNVPVEILQKKILSNNTIQCELVKK